MQAYAVRLWTSTSRYDSLSCVMKFRIQLATIRNYLIHIVQVHKLSDSSWARSWSLDMQISRSQLDNLRSQTLADERNANNLRLVNVLKRMLTNDRRNFFSNMLKKFRRTRLIELDGNFHKSVYTNSSTINDEHILIGTNSTQGLFGLYTQVVRLGVPLTSANNQYYES